MRLAPDHLYGGCTAKKDGDPSASHICASCCVIEWRRIPGSQRLTQSPPTGALSEPVFSMNCVATRHRPFCPPLLPSGPAQGLVKLFAVSRGFLVFVWFPRAGISLKRVEFIGVCWALTGTETLPHLGYQLGFLPPERCSPHPVTSYHIIAHHGRSVVHHASDI
jgi:hypothetical protein